MIRYPKGSRGPGDLLPQPGMPLVLALRKAVGVVWYYETNRALLEKFHTLVDQSIAAWRKVIAALRAAIADPAQEEDARLELIALVTEENRHSAFVTIMMAKHLRELPAWRLAKMPPQEILDTEALA